MISHETILALLATHAERHRNRGKCDNCATPCVDPPCCYSVTSWEAAAFRLCNACLSDSELVAYVAGWNQAMATLAAHYPAAAAARLRCPDEG